MEVVVNPPLPLTGERTAPGWEREAYWLARHQTVYEWLAQRMCEPEDLVIDVGCGEGYGCEILGQTATWVVGVELDEPSCRHAVRAYPTVGFLAANVISLPFPSSVADVVVSLQVMEHVWDVRRYLSELRRITRRLIAVSTPNRPMFSPGLRRHERPTNPFHVEEFDAVQVNEHLIEAGFVETQIMGLHHGQRISDWEAEHGSVVAALTTAVLTDVWPQPLEHLLARIQVSDFLITSDPTDAQDLIAVAS